MNNNRSIKSYLLYNHITRLLLCTILLFILMSILNPDRFLTKLNFISMSNQFPELGIFALAIMISLISGGIDLSIISIANLSGILAAMIITTTIPENATVLQTSLFISVAFVVIFCISVLCGLFNGFLIAHFSISPILATLGTMQLYTGISYVLTKGSAVAGYPSAFLFIGNGRIASMPVPLLLFIVLIITLHFVLSHTRLGMNISMMGTNPTAAWFSGISIKNVLLKTYCLSGVLSGIAGLIIITRTNSAKADYGSSYLLQAVLVAILAGANPRGGFGSVWGLVLAVLSLQVLSSGLNMLMFNETFGPYINNFTKELTWGALLLIVMVLNHYFQPDATQQHKKH